MKMFFDADEMVTIREELCGTWKIRKQEIADFLGREVDLHSGEKVLERAVILSNLTNVISIEIVNNIIELKPIGMSMMVSNDIIYLLKALDIEQSKK